MQLSVMFLSTHTVVKLNSSKAGNYKLKMRGRHSGKLLNSESFFSRHFSNSSSTVKMWKFACKCQLNCSVLLHQFLFVSQ